MPNKQETYNRAKLDILGRLIQFGMCYQYDGKASAPFENTYAFISSSSEPYPPIGSLCRLHSVMPGTKYYLSWLLEIKKADSHYSTQFLMKSIEDGSTCWWYNIGLSWLPTSTVEENADWKWSDRQFEFRDRWHRTLSKCDAYLIKSGGVSFGENYEVTVRTRGHVIFAAIGDFDSRSHSKTFSDFRKVKQKDLIDFYREVENKTDKQKTEKQVAND